MVVVIPPLEAGKVDVFGNDLMLETYLDLPENLTRKPNVAPLAMHVTSRPHAGDNKPIFRQAILLLLKLLAERAP